MAPSPIEVLPEELLVEIFKLGRPERDWKSRSSSLPRYLTRLGAVCTWWRAVSTTCSALWTTVSYSDPEVTVTRGPSDWARMASDGEGLQRYFAHSHDLPIDVSLTLGVDYDRVKLIFAVLREHVHRCHTLSLFYEYSGLAHLFLPLPSNVSSLRTLRLGAEEDDELQEPRDDHSHWVPLFESAQPGDDLRLQHLEICGAPYSFIRIGFDDIKGDRIKHLSIEPGALDEEDEERLLLRCAQNIEVLHYLDTAGRDLPFPLDMPRLTRITIGDHELATYATKIQTPALLRLTLIGEGFSAGRPDILIWPHLPLLRYLVIDNVNLKASHLAMLLAANPSIQRLRVHRWPPSGIARILDERPSAKLVPAEAQARGPLVPLLTHLVLAGPRDPPRGPRSREIGGLLAQVLQYRLHLQITIQGGLLDNSTMPPQQLREAFGTRFVMDMS